jgi:hypothetical protein
MTDNQKAVEEINGIKKFFVDHIFGGDGLAWLAKDFYALGYRPESEVRAEAVKELAEKIQQGLYGLDYEVPTLDFYQAAQVLVKQIAATFKEGK